MHRSFETLLASDLAMEHGHPVDHEYVPLPLNFMCFFSIKFVPKPQWFRHIS